MNIKIKKSAWHYWVATKLGFWKERISNPLWYEDDQPMTIKNTDFCGYLRRVLLGLLWIALMCAALFVYVYSTVVTIEHILNGTYRTHDQWQEVIGTVINSVIIAALFWFLMYKLLFKWGGGEFLIKCWLPISKLLTDRKKKEKKEHDPFYKAAYETLKHKFCVTMEIEK
jgi:hypothetical protein